MIQVNNLIGGKIFYGKQAQVGISPVDGEQISQINFLSKEELINVFKGARVLGGENAKKEYSELYKLSQFIKKNRLKFVDQIIKDAGFIQKDAEDLVDCSMEFCEDYQLHVKQIFIDDTITSFSFKKGSTQRIRLTSSPYGLISATTPRNTPLITELTVIVHAIWSGNTLVLRPSPGVAGTISLLIEGLVKSFSSETLMRLNIVFSNARDFVNISLELSNLLHYVGSSKYLESTLIAGIKKGIKVLVDGDGCSLIVVESSSNIEEVAKICYQALIRCNGQICISPRVIVVEEKVYKKFLTHFLNLIKKIVLRPPGLNITSDMGPLFSSAQVENIREVAKKYRSLYSKPSLSEYQANYIYPMLVELEPTDCNFLRESLFGPIVGLTYFKGDDWERWLKDNPINLTDAVFSNDEKFVKGFLDASKSPRKVVNLDPTIESVFEPWGAFLPSGWNDVSYWYSKYRNYYQLVKG